ncbi:ethanolaminephosphotransferase, partial [Paragonimus westermani]
PKTHALNWSVGGPIQFLFFLGIYSCGLFVFLYGLLSPDQVDSKYVHGNLFHIQRIHLAITSGRIPKFVDVLQNLNTHSMHEDNWVHRLSHRGWLLEFYGDDTWIKLFPDSFKRFDGTTSFFVKDYYQVDENVTRHLSSLFQRPETWDGLILHYLGLDHIGHVEGPNGRSIRGKLLEMDRVMGMLLKLLVNQDAINDNRWVFILTGDHGMRDEGGHGGSSLNEITTGLLLLGSGYSSSLATKVSVLASFFTYLFPADRFQTCSLPLSEMNHTQQVDLATLIGLLSGSGIPKSSLGLIPSDWLHNFWPDPLSKLMAVTRVMNHFAHLSGCQLIASERYDNLFTIKPSCSSTFISSDQISLFNNLMEQFVLSLVYFAQQNNSVTAHSQPQLELYMNSAHHLLTELQQHALRGSDHLDVHKMLIGGALMWLVTSILCLSVVYQLFLMQTSSGSFHNKTFVHHSIPARQLVSVTSAKFLCMFCTICILIQTISLAGSSFAEEEHQFWYYFSASSVLLSACLITLSRANSSTKLCNVTPLVVILLLDRVFLRQMHQTGNKWIHLPDLSDWLYSPEHSVWLWPAHCLAWAILIALRVFAIKHCSWGVHVPFRKQLFRYFPLLSIIGICAAQLCYRCAIAWSNEAFTVGSARLVYLLLLLDTTVAYIWRKHHESLHRVSFQPAEIDRFWSYVLHPVETFPLFVCLLGRPTVGFLWVGVVLKECLAARFFRLFWDCCDWTRSQSIKWFLTCCWLFYWIQGWVTFFQQGNSLSLASVDVSAAYVGLRNHQPVIAGLLLAFYTYAGPLYWQLAYVTRFALPKEIGSHVASSLACFRLGFAFLPVTFCATVCFLLQSHLFIWTVFTPKLLYLAVFHVVFIPVLISWGAMHV